MAESNPSKLSITDAAIPIGVCALFYGVGAVTGASSRWGCTVVVLVL